MRVRIVTGILIATIVAMLGGCIALNRWHVPAKKAAAPVKGTASRGVAGRSLRLATWNVGYAGMSRESDFKLDGGKQMRPLSKELVNRNLTKIGARLAQMDVDVVLLQEIARPSFSTYQVDVLEGVITALPDASYVFGADIRTRWIPPPFRTVIGNATFSRRPIARSETRGLPLEQTFQYGLFRTGYRMQIAYLAGPIEWVIVNVHLAAFDPDSEGIREQQIKQVLSFAEEQFAVGRHVVVGGDWNLRLAPTEFPHRTEARDLFWIRDLDAATIPAGWTVAVDVDRPTVRTANAPYADGVNYRLIIDGFLLSPNVQLTGVRTIDYDFDYSDHNPVIVDILAVSPPE